MSQKEQIQFFEERKVRTVWDDEKEEWFFSVVDVVEVLTDSADPKQYIKKMRARDPELNASWGTICTLTSEFIKMVRTNWCCSWYVANRVAQLTGNW